MKESWLFIIDIDLTFICVILVLIYRRMKKEKQNESDISD